MCAVGGYLVPVQQEHNYMYKYRTSTLVMENLAKCFTMKVVDPTTCANPVYSIFRSGTQVLFKMYTAE